MSYLYPKELAQHVYGLWTATGKTPQKTSGYDVSSQAAGLPDLFTLERILSICYQASLMTHEGEPIAFRLILAPLEEFVDDSGPPDGVQKLAFMESIPLSPSALRRLSPAARFSRSMIGLKYDPQFGLDLWGIIHTGPRWLHTNHGGRGTPPRLPDALVVKVMGPGVLEVSRGNRVLVSLSDGRIQGQSLNVFKSTWLQDWFAPIREERLEIHQAASQSAEEEWSALEPDLTKVIDQHMMKRVIAAMRAFRHGGTLIFVPPDKADMLTEVNPYLTMKYRFAESEGRARFRALILDIMNTLARLPIRSEHPIGWHDYQQTNDAKIMALDEAIFEMSHLVSSLSVADGAVILTKRFEILGFGAEIHCETVELNDLTKAVDLEGTEYRGVSMLGVGTRHRSAYRLCKQMPDALAIVVSQEGSVQFVRWVNDRLVFWEHQGSFDFADVN